MVHNMDHPAKTIQCYCAICSADGNPPTRHVRVPDTRFTLAFGDDALVVHHTDSDDATLVIRHTSPTGNIVMVLDQEMATRLAAFIDYEMFGQEGYE